jgi:hypothetical protein
MGDNDEMVAATQAVMSAMARTRAVGDDEVTACRRTLATARTSAEGDDEATARRMLAMARSRAGR